jgi:hypothetical protein
VGKKREREGRGKLFDKSSRRKELGKELKLRRQVKQMRREYKMGWRKAKLSKLNYKRTLQ